MITKEQREQRRHGVGGSDIGAIMGINPYVTALDIYKAKKEEPHEETETAAIEWGNRLESVIAQKFQDNHPDMDIVLSPETVIRGHKIANLDGAIGEDGVLEIKTANAFSEAWDNGVPAYYQAQVQWYMGVTDTDFAYVAVLIGGNDYREYRIDRDNAFIARAFDAADKFWSDFENDSPPAPQNTKEAGAVYPESIKDTYIDADEDLIKAASRLKEIKGELKDLESEEETLKTKLMKAMGAAENIRNGKDILCTWKTTKTNRFNSNAFKEAEPGLYEQFKTEQTYRTFRIK
jgi:putative phage-type endonuclease